MLESAPKLRVQPADRNVFWHILRYGLTTQEIVYRLFFDPAKQKPEAARSKLRRLSEGGYLQCETQPWRYYRLAPPAISLPENILGVAPDTFRSAAGSLKPIPLAERYAILAFSCLGETPRRVLIQHEFETCFPKCTLRGIRSWPYCVEHTSAGPVLCYIMVDSFSRVSLQVERIEKQFRRRFAVEAIRQLDLCGRFRIVVLTGSQQRCDELSKAFYDDHLEVAQTVVVPQLSSIESQGGL